MNEGIKVAVIIGANGGIGRALACEADKQGYQLALADLETGQLNEFAETLSCKPFCVAVDVSETTDVRNFASEVFDKFGRVDKLFNNAGIFSTGKILDPSDDSWSKIMDINFGGVLNAIKAFVPSMNDSGLPCRVINTASISGLYTSPMVGAYSVSKHAVVALSETLCFELAAENSAVNVSVICPGAVKTEILNPDRHEMELDRSDEADDYLAKMRASLSQNGMEPAELAEFVFKKLAEDNFWILPHPQLLKPVETRANNILSGINPDFKMTRTKKA